MGIDMSEAIPVFGRTEDMITALHPAFPVHCLRPDQLTDAAKTFVDGFPGDTLYAVKCNAHPLVLEQLYAAGIRHFDVASDHEIALVRRHCPEGILYYHHPAKTALSTANAYKHSGIRRFAVDCTPELTKVLANTGTDAAITVRMAVPQDDAVYDLSTKFGASFDDAVTLLAEAARCGREVGVTFHVGSQCLHPKAYETALELTAKAEEQAGVKLTYIDVGGGFPGYYRTTEAPPLTAYFERIAKATQRLFPADPPRILCEPGRALVYKAASLVTRVILRKESTVYLNDGIFGGFAEIYWGKDALVLECKVHRPRNKRRPAKETKPFIVYGPTCDGNDRLPYKVDLPTDIAEDDWIEFNNLGAYGREMSTAYNGMKSDRLVVLDQPY